MPNSIGAYRTIERVSGISNAELARELRKKKVAESKITIIGDNPSNSESIRATILWPTLQYLVNLGGDTTMADWESAVNEATEKKYGNQVYGIYPAELYNAGIIDIVPIPDINE